MTETPSATDANSSPEAAETEPVSTLATRHIDQSIPFEWKAYTLNDEQLLVHDVPDATVTAYRIIGTTLNPRTLASVDAVLYEGNVTTPVYDHDLRSMIFSHAWAGRMDRVFVEDWFDEPVPMLEELNKTDLSKTLDGGGL